ncbi:hypothetical protein [Pseudomonas citronellolis]|nr:hypothetical protein [Pseudomonas citronellolis]
MAMLLFSSYEQKNRCYYCCPAYENGDFLTAESGGNAAPIGQALAVTKS